MYIAHVVIYNDYIMYGVFQKKPAPKSFSHYFLIYRWKSMKLQKYFGYTIVNNILKSQKLSIILLGFIGLAPNDHHLDPYIFSSAQQNSTITLLQTGLGLALISSLMLTFTSEMFLGLLANTLSIR